MSVPATPCIDCGRLSRTQTPAPRCQGCAEAYFQGLVRTGAALAEWNRLLETHDLGPCGPRVIPLPPPKPPRLRRFTPRLVAQVRAGYAAGLSQAELGRRFSTGRSTIHEIVHGHTWQEVA